MWQRRRRLELLPLTSPSLPCSKVCSNPPLRIHSSLFLSQRHRFSTENKNLFGRLAYSPDSNGLRDRLSDKQKLMTVPLIDKIRLSGYLWIILVDFASTGVARGRVWGVQSININNIKIMRNERHNLGLIITLIIICILDSPPPAVNTPIAFGNLSIFSCRIRSPPVLVAFSLLPVIVTDYQESSK